MCGIAGVVWFNEERREGDEKVLSALQHRGPDSQGLRETENVTFYHTRLAIVDTSNQSAQPYSEHSEEDVLVYNGEVFNYDELGKSLPGRHTTGDVEVLYRLLREKGEHCLAALNGFFAFAYYSIKEKRLLLARDRYGVKPLYYYHDQEKFAFASELAALMQIIGPQPLNRRMFYTYLRLNYCAGNETIFENVYRLLPGSRIMVVKEQVDVSRWYTILENKPEGNLAELLEDAVRLRLHADVPLGTFLSGGLDSSIISALAAKHKKDLHTFSIGFKGAQYLDESKHAEVVAKHIRSTHHAFQLQEDDFLNQIDPFLDSMDEPFADSSAFNVFMLSMYTRRHVKVALTGDGADELFKGYAKHRALLLSNRSYSRMAGILAGMLIRREGKRTDLIGNKTRQAKKFATLSALPAQEKIKFLASIATHAEVANLMHQGESTIYFDSLFSGASFAEGLSDEDRFDLEHVLSDDMLVKTDRYSMRHGLELRNPFLDHRVVSLAMHMSVQKKISSREQKIVLRKTFGHLLPTETLRRSKQGFEVPLQLWLTQSLRSRVEGEWLNGDAIEEEGLFSREAVNTLKHKLFSNDPGDSAAKAWAIIVFRHWYKRNRALVAKSKSGATHKA